MMYSEYLRMCQVTTGSLRVDETPAPYIESPNPDAMMHKSTDPVVVQPNGVLLQRCGGGKRVLRKRIGTN